MTAAQSIRVANEKFLEDMNTKVMNRLKEKGLGIERYSDVLDDIRAEARLNSSPDSAPTKSSGGVDLTREEAIDAGLTKVVTSFMNQHNASASAAEKLVPSRDRAKVIQMLASDHSAHGVAFRELYAAKTRIFNEQHPEG